MNLDHVDKIEDLDHENTARFVIDMFYRMIFHYVFWFDEVKHQMGTEKALKALKEVSAKTYAIQMKRLANILGFEMHNGIPEPLLKISQASLLKLIDGMATNCLK